MPILIGCIFVKSEYPNLISIVSAIKRYLSPVASQAGHSISPFTLGFPVLAKSGINKFRYFKSGTSKPPHHSSME